MHHGSLDREVRDAVEQRLRDGTLKCVVATSQPRSRRGFLAGGSSHPGRQPEGNRAAAPARRTHRPPAGGVSRIVGVPTHALELVEFAAARDALAAGQDRGRPPLRMPLDVLLQHLVTVAVGEGFRADDMLAEVRSTHAYAGLCDREWAGC